jgi:hypothetical protein
MNLLHVLFDRLLRNLDPEADRPSPLSSWVRPVTGEDLANLCSSAGVRVTNIGDQTCRFEGVIGGIERTGGIVGGSKTARIWMLCHDFDFRHVPYGAKELASAVNRASDLVRCDVFEEGDANLISLYMDGAKTALNPRLLRKCLNVLADDCDEFVILMQKKGLA